MSREPLKSERNEQYERHAGGWMCGDATNGDACPLGPSRLGVCSKQTDCTPLMREGRWFCGRPTTFGGPCECGPNPDGVCGRPVRDCKPLPMLRKRRGEIVLGVAALTFGIILALYNGKNKQEFIAPGPLTDSHAQLLKDSGRTNRCSACHPESSDGTAAWSTSILVAKTANDLNQSDLCLNCHRDKLGDSAFLTHSLSENELAVRTTSAAAVNRSPFTAPVPANEHGEIVCSTCHREHHGARHDLTAMTNSQCKNCHQNQFDDFLSGHPEFNDWPSHKPAIRAAHAAHRSKHFPEARAEYNCRQCHQHDGHEEIVPVVGFASCAKCHEEKLVTGIADGVTLANFPMLDVEQMPNLPNVEQMWPTNAQGCFDGRIPPLMRLLLLADNEIADDLVALGDDFDFIDVDEDSDEQLDFCNRFVLATHRLYNELGRDARETIERRLSVALGTPPTAATVDGLIQGLPRNLIRDTLKKWTPKTTKLQSDGKVVPVAWWDDDFDNDSDAFDLTGEETVADESTGDEEPIDTSDIQGWFRAPDTCSFVYRPAGHADPLVKTLIEIAMTPLPTTAHSGTRETLAYLKQTHLVTQCLSCHAIDETGGEVRWQNDRSSSLAKRFTKFSHRPHLVQPQLRDCTHCHDMLSSSSRQSDADAAAANVGADAPQMGHSEFAPIYKAACASCHVPHAAGDSCLKCHNYHVTPSPSKSKAVLTVQSDEATLRRRRQVATRQGDKARH